MQLRKLEDLFYDENTHLVEVLDKDAGGWVGDKTRGYGIVVFEVRGLTFGIPLRSHVAPSNKHSYLTKGQKGLDFSKAVLLTKEAYIADEAFRIPGAEYQKLRDNEYVIEKKFQRYVDRYIKLCTETPESTVLGYEYRFSTLVNYHLDLGIVEQAAAPAPAQAPASAPD
ncbi:hypothetical protein V2K41_18420 [Pseudomonas alliivorans]|uniref:type III toxin-antitoxin system TenpIN family toxin n=1 Tax=Pseudomonas TaxID=286 RepID=UPI002EB0935B|nr:hypothetical protein [Pseudomonas viridiflava]MEE4916250.1 hypothetical protein [Pseudomonas alliivorans]MEE3929827.1 hypothetical protein [Pseudomonas viridiflava]MEE3941016.1 hypothetical protein [Pseudomonas viridiflava]MEE3967026.1 hypothetical protein [Pseudomonas viridiflava]